MLKKLFTVDTDPDKPWYRVILWWEKRRVPFNFMVILFGVLAVLVESLLVEGLHFLKSEKLFFSVLIMAYLVVVNVLYTGGWIFQLATKGNKSSFVKKITPKLYGFGLKVFFILSFLPVVATVIFILIKGEPPFSVYPENRGQPMPHPDIAGEYILAPETARASVMKSIL
jgi:hypothetical protein